MMRLTRARRIILTVAIALAGVTAAAGSADAAPKQAHTTAKGDLYYVTGGYIARVPVAGGTPQRLVRIGGVSVTGMAVADGRLYWVTQDTRGRLDYITLGKGIQPAHTLVSGIEFAAGLATAGGWLYWADENAIGRVRPGGESLSRRFVVPPQETGGGVANGLATDGRYLYFSRCQDNEISRVATSGHGANLRFIRLPAQSCPQQLAVGNDHLYWTVLIGHIGRATLNGQNASDTWLAIRSGEGPFNVAADNASVYWDWGGTAGSPMHIGTATVSGAHLRTTYLLGQGALLLTAPGAA